MKELLKFLPQILGNLKYVIVSVVVIAIIGGIGYGVYLFSINYKDPYKCVNGEIYKQIEFNSAVYVFKGGYCVDGNQSKR